MSYSVVDERGAVVARPRSCESAHRASRRRGGGVVMSANAADGSPLSPMPAMRSAFDVVMQVSDFNNRHWRERWVRMPSKGAWKDYYRFKKRFGSVWYELLISRTWSGDTVHATPSSMRALFGRPQEERDRISKEVSVFVDVRGLTMEDLDKKVAVLAARYRELTGPRKMRSVENVAYSRSPSIVSDEESRRELRGKEAIAAWKKDVEVIVLKEYAEPSPAYSTRQSTSTSSVALNVIENYSRIPDGVSKKRAVGMVGSVLESMARRGLISKLTGGERVEWAPRERT